MINKVLPLSAYYDNITSFINIALSTETGLISKYLINAIKQIIRDYILFVNTLENEFLAHKLDIQRLWYLCQPSMKIFENLQKYINYN